MKKRCICLVFFLSYFNISFGQLSGTYTIGGTAPDYVNLTQAGNAINSLGLSGPVVFNIRAGYYHDYINFGNTQYQITFQSETLDSSSVTISTCPTCQGIFNDAKNVIFNELTIIDTIGSAIKDPRNINIKNCVITSPVIGINYWGGGNDTILNSIINCNITGFGCTIYYNKNVIHGNINSGNITCNQNLIFGNISISSCGYFYQNEVHGSIYGGCVFKNNIVFSNNVITISVSYYPVQFINNEIHGGLSSFAFDNFCQIIGNKFYGDFVIGQTEHFSVFNNFFYKTVGIAICHYSTFAFNNCASDSGQYFTIQNSQFNSITNNILPLNFFDDYPLWDTISNNNYPFSGGYYDKNPWFIDPQFVSPSDLHTKNFQLSAKGNYSSQVLFDIDSQPRHNPPTIGANEVCISSDTVTVFCGDTIQLSFCQLPQNGNYYWQPGAGLNDSTIATPFASITTSNLYIITDSLSGFTDSVFINVIPFQVHTNADTLIPCGNRILLNTTYNAGATYNWSPSIGLSDTNSFFTNANPTQTTTYVVSAFVNGCGISFDSVTITIDSIPRAYAQYSDTGLTAYFNNLSTCASTYLWYFGDGDSSILFEPNHTYLFCGSYLVMLIACNNVGCDTIIGNIYVCNVGIEETGYLNDLKIYPNPSDGNLFLQFNSKNAASSNLQIKIIDILGNETILEKQSGFNGNYSNNLNLSMLSNGIYFLTIRLGDNVVSKKIIIQNN